MHQPCFAKSSTTMRDAVDVVDAELSGLIIDPSRWRPARRLTPRRSAVATPSRPRHLRENRVVCCQRRLQPLPQQHQHQHQWRPNPQAPLARRLRAGARS